VKTIYPLLLMAWLIAFGVEVIRFAQAHNAFRRTADQIDQTTDALNTALTELRAGSQKTKTLVQENDFLQGLINVLPQEKGFIRTQKAISDDVEVLRQKVVRRVHQDLHIVVDARANKLYLKKGLTLLWEADCSVGKGGVLIDRKTGRRWEFATPRGQFEVLDKIANPLWTRPDWSFVEAGESVPPPGDPKRKVPGELGAYVLNLGDGYLIHGTKTEALLGHSVSHGCVRLGAGDLKKLYDTVPLGTAVFIY
jgi:L,D-transpeptidase YbiS